MMPSAPQQHQPSDEFDFDIDEVTSAESSGAATFKKLSSTILKIISLSFFSAASIGFGLVMMLLHAFFISGDNMVAMHSTSTFPILMGFFAAHAAWTLMSTPEQVTVRSDGIQVDGPPNRMIPWNEIGAVIADSHTSGVGFAVGSLKLMDVHGKQIIKIGGALENFKRLIELAREGAKGSETESKSIAHDVPDRTALKLGKRRAMMTGFGTILFGAATGLITYDGWWNHQAAQRMASEGVSGVGTVVRHFVAPNGVTRRIEYEVWGDNGQSASHNVEVETELHGRLNVGDTIDVRFVAADPRISHLVAGEIQDGDKFLKSTAGVILLSICSTIMTIFMASISVISWKGYDIKVDGVQIRMAPLGK